MTLRGNATKHSPRHPLYERNRTGNETATLAFINNPVADTLIGCMMPCDEDLAVGFKSRIVTSIVQARGLRCSGH